MAKSMTKNQRNRRRRRRFACDWEGQEKASRARQAAQAATGPKGTQKGEPIIRPWPSGAGATVLYGTVAESYRQTAGAEPQSDQSTNKNTASAARGTTRRLWPPRPDMRL